MHHTLVAATVFSLLLAPLAAQDPLTRQALQRIEEVEKKEATLPAGDVKAANLLLNTLDQAGKRLNAVNDKTEAKWKEAQQRFTDVRKRIEAKAKAAPAPTSGGLDAEKLAQLDKEIAAATANFKLLSTKHLADPFRAKSTQKELDAFAARLAQFPAGEEPVKQVAARLTEFQQLFATGMAQLQKDVGAGAAVGTRLAELDAKYDSKQLPQAIEPPFTEAQVTAWVTEIRRWRDTEIPADRQFLAEAAKNAAVDQQHVARLRGWLDEGFGRRITEVETAVRSRIEADVADGQRIAEFVLATDSNDKDQVTNRILGAGRFDENMLRLRAAEQAVAVAKAYDIAMGSTAAPERAAATDKAQKAIEHLQKLAVACLDAVRMPAPASTDADLLRIATETLKTPSYGVPPAERLVINADKTRRERREGWIKPDTNVTTVTVYRYLWDQFQVTTAERQGDEVWLWANTLKRYESGDPTTPIGRWVLSERFQLTRILPANLGK